jgi:hypothetical protein
MQLQVAEVQAMLSQIEADGNDWITASPDDGEGIGLYGLDGNDVLTGLWWEDTRFGDAGDDLLDDRGGRLASFKHLATSPWVLEGELVHAFANAVDGGREQNTLVLQDFSFWQWRSGPVQEDCKVMANLAAGTVDIDAIPWSDSFRTGQVTGIESLTCAGWNDALSGDAGATLLLDGGSGFDILLLESLTFGGVTHGLSAEGHLRLGTAEGTDTLIDVEEVRFLDGRLVFDPDAPESVVARL